MCPAILNEIYKYLCLTAFYNHTFTLYKNCKDETLQTRKWRLEMERSSILILICKYPGAGRVSNQHNISD